MSLVSKLLLFALLLVGVGTASVFAHPRLTAKLHRWQPSG
jgi:hypothetical protein